MRRMPVEDRRAALVAATLAVVEREGVEGATARAVVREAGMPLGALHYAFDSLDDLLAAAAEAVTEDERLAASGAIPGAGSARTSATLEDILAAGLERYVALLVARPERELAFLELTLRAARRGLHEDDPPTSYRSALSAAEDLLAGAAAACGVTWSCAPERVARLAVTALDGLTTVWLQTHDTAGALDTARFTAGSLARLAHPVGTETPDARRS